MISNIYLIWIPKSRANGHLYQPIAFNVVFLLLLFFCFCTYFVRGTVLISCDTSVNEIAKDLCHFRSDSTAGSGNRIGKQTIYDRFSKSFLGDVKKWCTLWEEETRARWIQNRGSGCSTEWFGSGMWKCHRYGMRHTRVGLSRGGEMKLRRFLFSATKTYLILKINIFLPFSHLLQFNSWLCLTVLEMK